VLARSGERTGAAARVEPQSWRRRDDAGQRFRSATQRAAGVQAEGAGLRLRGDFEKIVCRTLREEGYEVVACPDRGTVLTLAFDDPPDVILYTLAPRSPVDRGVLQLLRRALRAPR